MLKKEQLAKMVGQGPEVLVYMAIEYIGGFIWRMNHDMAHGRIPQEDHASIDRDIASARPEQIELVKCLTRFGVESPLDEEDNPTKDYRKWYSWWSQWHKGMPDEEWEELNAIIDQDMSDDEIARCRPEGRWQDVEME